jgi:hypothetical protein
VVSWSMEAAGGGVNLVDLRQVRHGLSCVKEHLKTNAIRVPPWTYSGKLGSRIYS